MPCNPSSPPLPPPLEVPVRCSVAVRGTAAGAPGLRDAGSNAARGGNGQNPPSAPAPPSCPARRAGTGMSRTYRGSAHPCGAGPRREDAGEGGGDRRRAPVLPVLSVRLRAGGGTGSAARPCPAPGAAQGRRLPRSPVPAPAPPVPPGGRGNGGAAPGGGWSSAGRPPPPPPLPPVRPLEQGQHRGGGTDGDPQIGRDVNGHPRGIPRRVHIPARLHSSTHACTAPHTRMHPSEPRVHPRSAQSPPSLPHPQHQGQGKGSTGRGGGGFYGRGDMGSCSGDTVHTHRCYKAGPELLYFVNSFSFLWRAPCFCIPTTRTRVGRGKGRGSITPTIKTPPQATQPHAELAESPQRIQDHGGAPEGPGHRMGPLHSSIPWRGWQLTGVSCPPAGCWR